MNQVKPDGPDRTRTSVSGVRHDLIEPPLAVSPYERAAAGITTGLILVGSVVVMMFLVWLTSRVLVKQTALEPQLIEPLPGGGGQMGSDQELADASEDLVDEVTPPEFEEALETVSEVVSAQPVEPELDLSDRRPAGRGTGRGRGMGSGEGDGQGVPREERWELLYPSASLAEYARQLDYFGIELAAVGGGQSQVDYAFHLAKPKPDRRQGTDDSRLYFRWSRESATKEADQQLLQRAGIDVRNRIILKFIPPKLENQCALLERDFLRGKNLTLDQVRRTVFSVTQADQGYAFRVERVQTQP